MIAAQRKAQLAHRQRQKKNGIKRVEFSVHKDDVALLRRLAEALANPGRNAEIRDWLRVRLGGGKAAGFKALLASASLKGVDLRRRRDSVRDIDL